MIVKSGLGIAAGAAVAVCASVAAAEESFPRISGEVGIEVQNDLVFEADDESSELNDLYTTIEPAVRIEPVEHLAIVAGLVLEPVQDAEDDRFFEDEGLYVEQLFLEYYDDWGTVYGGKFNPPFGIAWDLAPGIYGADLAEDYELTEQLGGGVVLGFGAPDNGYLGVVEVSANVFVADRTPLSQSLITGRGDLDLDDGGPANTEGPGGFSVTLTGGDIAALPGLAYHAGVRFRAGGEGDPSDEVGGVFGLVQTFELGDDQAVEIVGEVAGFNDFEAGENDAVYATLGGAYVVGGWNVALTGAYRDSAIDDEQIESDRIVQISTGYAFDFGLGVDVGYRFGREDGADTHTLGALVAYGFEF